MSIRVSKASDLPNHLNSEDPAVAAVNRIKRNMEDLEAFDDAMDIHEAFATKRPRRTVRFDMQDQDDSNQTPSELSKFKNNRLMIDDKRFDLSDEDDTSYLSEEEAGFDDSLSWFDDWCQEEKDGSYTLHCHSDSRQQGQVLSFRQKHDATAYLRLQQEQERLRRAAARLVHSNRPMRISHRFSLNLYNTPSRSFEQPPSPVRCVRFDFENVEAWRVAYQVPE